ncbi:NUDIX hydrolase [Paenibacillus glycanilyticus]|uniref:Nudix hydrolase domain-containing protein n=1 Tax=Paenibacillus glycanilyticus TaxID=126569 RepID=A0ABQ6GHN5_9BACL|nr:NUDIX domain-containing protein [Paenibacillus glycanilyticus]GLX70333.1 hypothetical protein MU1_46790 [Paenibacillus glycanilyticus]
MLKLKITDSDVIGGDTLPVYMDTVSRYAARGVLINNDNQVAMMYMASEGMYKLPGGGIDEGELAEAAFVREILEETGYEAEVTGTLGFVEEHKHRNRFFQYSHCYLAQAGINTNSITLTASEQELGMAVQWMNIGQAVSIMDRSLDNVDVEYSDRFMLLRDYAILKEAVKRLT